MKYHRFPALALVISGLLSPPLLAEESTTLYGAARREAKSISTGALAVPLDIDTWTATKQQRREQWLEMIGLSPLPARSPLQAEVTGTLQRNGYVVEKVHFQSLPGAYVVGNLYRPAVVTEPLPAVLYLCGHTKGKVSPTYQSHPRWFGQHGYVALVLDPIQLGESQGFHHGTHRAGRWDWQSRGYTPAGTEVWNAIRALDYLESRSDVDPTRMGVTGLSGGGVISWCLGAADERVKVVVPVCQSGSIEQVVTDRGADGHCDCAFWINYYRWCWSDVGSLIAPRPFLIASGSEDVLWRPIGYRDVAQRIRGQYASLNAADRFDLVEDLSPHGYTPKLRKAIFTWFNTHLKGDPTPVTEDVTDYIEPEENLLVFGGTLPEQDAMRHVDRTLVARGERAEPEPSNWLSHQRTALDRLAKTTFRHTVTPERPALDEFRHDGRDTNGVAGSYSFRAADGVPLWIRTKRPHDLSTTAPLLVTAAQGDVRSSFNGGGTSRPAVSGPVATAVVEVRNTGATSIGPGFLWSLRRSYPLLGQTLPERQVSDLLRGIALLRGETRNAPIAVYGRGDSAVTAIYAALLDRQIRELVLADPPTTHEDPETPEFLGVLRLGDLPENLALAFPRPITFVGELPVEYRWTQQVYERLGRADRFRVIPHLRQWQPHAESTVDSTSSARDNAIPDGP